MATSRTIRYCGCFGGMGISWATYNSVTTNIYVLGWFSSFIFIASFCLSVVAEQHQHAVTPSTRLLSHGLGHTLDESRHRGYAIMRNPLANKGLAFSRQQREELGLEGLLPYAVLDMDTQIQRCMAEIRSKSTSLEKYIYLQTLQDANENLYYALLIRHAAEVLPLVYTPTVGEACENFHRIYRQTPRGMYLNLNHKGRIKHVLSNWPHKDIKAIVATDGERILGLGDLGVNGMGIPIGKLALYTAFGGVFPENCLPVHLDVGTNNEALRNNPFYMGIRQKRATGAEYDEFIDEFITAGNELYGRSVMIQFEDFGNQNAFPLLHKYQKQSCCFNDDIQGTAAVVLGGLLASSPLTNTPLANHTFLFLGAGGAGIGIADLIVYALQREGLSVEEARSKIWLVDSQGLVVSSRMHSLSEQKQRYAHEYEHLPDFLSAVHALKPTVIIGAAAQPNAFNQQVCNAMAEYSEHPLILALSNPTSKAECTAQDAYTWTQGKCIFASGSPFDPVMIHGKLRVPGQANNAYVFPGIGLGAVACGATKLDDEDMYCAAKALASQVSKEQLEQGCIYPSLASVRDVSARIAAAICDNAYSRGSATVFPQPSDTYEHCKSLMYSPTK